MAYVQQCKSKRTGQVINYKWTALIGRDENYKQIRLTKRVEPFGLTPAREMKEQQARADEWEKIVKAEYEKEHGASAEEKLRARKERERITLESFIDEHWIKKHVQNGTHTPDTVAFYNNMAKDIKAYFREYRPEIRLSQLDKEDVLDYLAYMRNDAKTQRGTPYGKTTIQHHFSTLRNILEYAVYMDYISEDPCKKLKPTDRPKREQKEVDFLAPDEAVRFMTALDSEEEREYWEQIHGSHLGWKCLINTLILTGLRRGELVGLQWGDLDTKKMLLHIRRNVTIDTTHKDEQDPAKKIHIGETKGKEVRKVPISKYLCDLLTAFKTEQEKKYGALFMPNAYIFSRPDDVYLPIYPTEPTRLLRKYNKRHKLPDMSPHDLRHTAASLAIESGASVKEIQGLLGHKDPGVTLKFYAGLTEKAQQRTIMGIEDMLRPKEKTEEKKA